MKLKRRSRTIPAQRLARGHAYTPIVASGYNACVLHYITNDQVCNDGDVILMDFGCEYGGYAAT